MLARSAGRGARRASWTRLAAGVGAAALITGCGGGGSSHRTPPVVTATGQAQSAAPARPARPASNGHAPATRHTTIGSLFGHGAVATRPATIKVGRVIRVIAGRQSKRIGSLTEKRSTVVVWVVAKAPIQIVTSSGHLLMSSDARTGRITLAQGHYRGLRVAAPGRWTLQLRVAL